MKIDLLKEFKAEYAPSKRPVLLEPVLANYLAVDGEGPPGGADFQTALEALYPVAYALKFQSKQAGKDYGVCKLEGVYGVRGQAARDLLSTPRELWKWQHCIRVPLFVKQADLERARGTLIEKGKSGAFERIYLQELNEGQCVQMLHVGPYEEEIGTIELMHAFAREQGWAPSGTHREIYLSDPRRVPAEKRRTLLRHQVQRA